MVAIKNRAIQLLVLGLLAVGSVFAQAEATLECTLLGTQHNVRAEGQAELMGDIVYTCNSSDLLLPGPWTTFPVNIIVNLSVNVTSNIDFQGNDDNIIDASLTINDANARFGVLISPTQIAFDNVLIPFPGEGTNPNTTTIRIVSIRGNASLAGIPGVGQQVAINANLSSEPASILAVPNPSVIVGLSWLTLISDGVDDEVNGLQCVDLEDTESIISMHEGFASAWKTQGVPSDAKNTFWESGFFAASSNNGAGASQETQFKVTFSDVPDGATISVDNTVFGDFLLELTLLSGSGSASFGALCDGAGGTEDVNLDVDGNGYVIYGVCDNDPTAREAVEIPIHTSWDLEDATPDVGSASVTVSYYPLGGSNFADKGDPEPRFVDTASAPEEFLTIAKCVTTLLFPFVTNQSGFDTGLVVSNTSEDWGLSAIEPQDGECEIHYIGTDTSGEMPPNDVTDSDVEAGTQLVWLLSSGGTHGLVGAPDFQGYILAACDFQYAHGYAFITDGFGGGAPALAQGYLALVIPANRGISDGGAEQLDN